MRVFKWSPDFRSEIESSIVLVWFALPGLPIHLFHKATLFSIANLIGTPLMVDEPTASLTRPSVARICIEIDLHNPLPKRIWIAGETKFHGFWQEITPEYATTCTVYAKDTWKIFAR